MRAWGGDLITGYEELDREHQVILDLAHKIVRAVHNGTKREETTKMIEMFVDYANRHYATEEGLMLAFAYPGKDSHVAEHREMQATLASISERYHCKGSSVLVNLVLRGVVRQWFNHHIRTEDKKLVEFLHRSLKGGEATEG